MMSRLLKVFFAASTLASLCTANVYAKPEHWYAQRSQVDYSGYTDARGQYANLADLTRSVEGTPCGIECTQSHMRLWGSLRERE
jgi:hypothetical protein